MQKLWFHKEGAIEVLDEGPGAKATLARPGIYCRNQHAFRLPFPTAEVTRADGERALARMFLEVSQIEEPLDVTRDDCLDHRIDFGDA